MTGIETITGTEQKEMDHKQERIEEIGPSQGTTDKGTMKGTPGIDQGRITDHTTEKLAETGDILVQEKESQEEVAGTAEIDTLIKQAYHYIKRILQEWSFHQSTKWT